MNNPYPRWGDPVAPRPRPNLGDYPASELTAELARRGHPLLAMDLRQASLPQLQAELHRRLNALADAVENS